MPTYEYRCGKCGEHLEVYQSFAEEPLTKHKSCGGKLTKVLSAAGIVLKGSGFYKNDSRTSSPKKAASPAKSSESAAASGSTSSSDGTSGSGSEGSTGGSEGPKSGGSEAKSA
jgi:putative FmdB family regulatory protein